MSAAENFKPDSIPDMTLPERGDKPPPPMPDMTLPERASAPEQIEKPPPVWERAPASPAGWKIGDRVLAPWEPGCLYAGTIKEIDKIGATIQFDDGDVGRVYLEQLRKISIQSGQRVSSRRKMGPVFGACEIVEVRGEEVLVRFAEGDEEWTRIAALRIPSDDDDHRGADGTVFASNRAFLDSLRKGDRVWAPWNAGVLYVGTIEELRDDEAHIHFDDGDQGWVHVNQLLPFEPTPGMTVLVNYQRAGQYYLAVIQRVDGERLYVRVEGVGAEWTTPAALALHTQAAGPDARPTRQVASAGGGTRWWVWAVIAAAIGFAIMRAMLR